MKRIITLILSMLMLLSIFAMTASAAPQKPDFKADYFKDGKLETPEAPYIKDESENHGGFTFLTMYYYQIPALQKLALDIQKDENFYDKYGINDLDTFLQVDAKFNDGEWLSTKGKWSELNEHGWIVYGDKMTEMNGNFALKGEKHADDASKLQHFTQTYLNVDREAEENAFLLPFLKTEQLNETDKRDYFDFSELTITYRIRWVVRCLIDEYEDTRQEFILTSDWSPEVAIGKNGKNQEEPKMPEKLEAPVLSKFELRTNNDGSGEISYFAELPDSIYQAERYKLIKEDSFEPYIIEAQIKVNDGKWQDCGVANATWLQNGERVAAPDGYELKLTDDAWIRIRVVSTQDENEKSPWSNVIGTKAVKGADFESSDGKLDNKESKCKLCGICPIQPLGICLFIWIAIIIIIVIIVVIVVVRGKKKKNDTVKE